MLWSYVSHTLHKMLLLAFILLNNFKFITRVLYMIRHLIHVKYLYSVCSFFF